MDLNSLDNTHFLEDLNNKELKKLCEEIRTFLIQNISKTGGHLASNLGVVELTVGLHKVFNDENDKIIFDVGHQAYTHNILFFCFLAKSYLLDWLYLNKIIIFIKKRAHHICALLI